MTVLILTGTYQPEAGGIAELVSGFAAALLRQGIRVHVLAATRGASGFSSPHLPVTEFEMPPQGYLRRILACRRAVLELTRREDFDRVIASSWSPLAVNLPAIVNGRKLPVDILCHGMDLLEPSSSLRYRLLMRRTLRRADRVLVNSRYTAQLASAMGARYESITVVYPAVDPELFVPGNPDQALLARYQIPLEAPVLLSVGRLIERKGFDLVIRALPKVLEAHPWVTYLVVGDGPDRQRLLDLASKTGVNRNVRFAGNVPTAERVAHYQLAKVFVMPNRLVAERGDVEGFGIVFLEAACCEVPSIGGRSGGVPEAIEDGTTGCLVDPFSIEDCARTIILLLSDDSLRMRMARAARERARSKFSWQKVTYSYLSQLNRDWEGK